MRRSGTARRPRFIIRVESGGASLGGGHSLRCGGRQGIAYARAATRRALDCRLAPARR